MKPLNSVDPCCDAASLPGEGALLFVYGTLRRGFENHEDYLHNAQFMGNASTRDEYALVVGELPYVVKDRAVARIVGELYAVDAATLEQVDGLEGHPDEYRREEILVLTGQGQELCAWIYFYPDPVGELIASGDFSAAFTG
jgi:gamma-glutamylaminecyclotransferase